MSDQSAPRNGVTNAADELIAVLVSADAASLTTFELDARVDLPGRVLGSDPSGWTETVALTRDGDVRVRKATVEYAQAPAYVAPGFPETAPNEYNDAGELMLLRTLRSSMLADRSRQEVWDTMQATAVTPAGDYAQAGPTGTFITRFDPGPVRLLPAWEWALMGLGRGFSGYLGKGLDVREGADGRVTLTAKGELFEAGRTGTWTLVVDVDAGHLVREASFVDDGETLPSLIVRSSGLLGTAKAGLAAQGSVQLTSVHEQVASLKISGTAYSPRARTTLIEEVRASMAAPLGGDHVVQDLRGSSPSALVDDGEIGAPIDDLGGGVDPGTSGGTSGGTDGGTSGGTDGGTDGGTSGGTEPCCTCENSQEYTRDECFHLAEDYIPPSPGHPYGQSNCPAVGTFKGHPKAKLCIHNVIHPQATCVATGSEGQPQCSQTTAIVAAYATQYLYLSANDCPNAGTTQDYTVRLTHYSSCPSCTPAGARQHKFSCDNPEPTCSGLLLETSPRWGLPICLN